MVQFFFDVLYGEHGEIMHIMKTEWGGGHCKISLHYYQGNAVYMKIEPSNANKTSTQGQTNTRQVQISCFLHR